MIDEEACPSAQAFTSWAKSRDLVAIHLEVDGDRGAAQLRMGGGRGVRRGQPAQAGDISRQVEDSGVVNLVKHWRSFDSSMALADLPRAVQMNI